MKKLLPGSLLILILAVAIYGQVPTTINDFHLPGSQPTQSGTIQTSDGCNCHAGYNKSAEPAFNWKGSMMAQAARDPLFWATMTIAEQDAPGSGDLCLRCHTPKGWLENRSTPTDGSALIDDDRDGVNCHFCHKSIKPTAPGVNPYPGDADYTATTYNADQLYITNMTDPVAVSANGMYIVDSIDFRRGPYTDAGAPHDFYYSPYHRDAAMCGTCHDVSNPAFTKDANGKYLPNDFDTPPPDSNPYSMFPVERTFSEWKYSAYNTSQGVYAPQFGGNLDTVRTCQDCHMRDVTGKGAKGGGAPERTDLGLHDMTGGNTFIPTIINQAFPGDNVDQEALDSGIVRATRMLQAATSMSASASASGSQHLVNVNIVNETGHKLPSGYPEGRRMWINVKAFDIADNLIYESGAYDLSTGVLTKDGDVKVYEIKPGISTTLSGTVGIPAGPSFHFVLNDTIYSDNRIPPRGFTNANYEMIQSPPVDYSYPDGQYWDDTEYLVPGSADSVHMTLYYQTTSKEYVVFLRDENVTDTLGQLMYDLWNTNGKSAPVVMNEAFVTLTPLAGNNPPVLDPIGNKSVNEGVELAFTVTASDPDGTIPDLTTSTLPSGASFTDNQDGSGSFSWTPSFEQSGTYDLTFYATDDSAAVDSEQVTITVNNVNRDPVLTDITDKSVNEGVELAFGVSATDPDGNIPDLTTSTLPTGATFTDNEDGTGSFSWTPTFDQSGTYEVTFYATDDSAAADSDLVTITVNNINRPPVLDSIGDKSTNESVLLAFTVTATDPDGTIPDLTASQLPSGASFTDNNDGTGSFEWTPSVGQAGAYDVIFVATDDSSAADSETVHIDVLSTNVAPVLSAVDDHSVPEGGALNFTLTATDGNNDSLWYTSSTLPANATLIDNGDGTAYFSFSPAYDQAAIYDIIFTVHDGEYTDEDTSQITVTNTNRAPSFASVSEQTVEAGSNLTFNVSASDPDGESVDLLTEPLPTGASFTDHNDGTGAFDWTPSVDQTGVWDISFFASDGSLEDTTIVAVTVTSGGCCVGLTGNVNADAEDVVDVSDLTRLVNHLFVTFEPLPCVAEANIDGDEQCNIDIADLTRLVNHLFVTFEDPAACNLTCEQASPAK